MRINGEYLLQVFKEGILKNKTEKYLNTDSVSFNADIFNFKILYTDLISSLFIKYVL